MNVKSFLSLVEMKTKVASVIPFLVGVFFTVYRFHEFQFERILLFFVCMLSIDLATTSLNNYMDYKKDRIRQGYHYEVHNAIVAYHLSISTVKVVIGCLLSIGIISGLLIVLWTDWIILLIGIISFGIGILYSYGPIPISRTPFGELVSGVFMGGLIVFTVIYIQIYSLGIIKVIWNNTYITIDLNYIELLIIALVAMPLIAGISNIMFANNISDIDEDIKNNRFTLVYYLGKKCSLMMFSFITFSPFIFILVTVILIIAPISCLIVFLALPSVNKRLNSFKKLQTKKDTFILAVLNFIIPSTLYCLGYLIAIIS